MTGDHEPDAESAGADTSSEETARRLARLVAHLPGMAYRCRVDAEWRTELASEGARVLAGYSADEVVRERGRSYPPLAHPDDVERVRAEVRSALDAGRRYDVAYRIVHADGEIRRVRDRQR